MKNYLLFIIDSLNYSHVKNSQIELMPFFESLKKRGLSCENMYSQAPYTEAAVMNLYCGQDVLQNGGYLFRFKNAEKTIFEVMKEHGYKTYYNSYQPQCYPSSMRRGIDDIYYNVGFDLGALWSYRLYHYSELFRLNKLQEKDYLILLEILKDNFVEWLRFIDELQAGSDSVSMIKENDSMYDVVKVRSAVQKEYDDFKANSREYINLLLIQGYNHKLFTIPAYIQRNKIKNRQMIEKIRLMYRPLLKRIKKMNTKLNLRNAKGLMRGPVYKGISVIKKPGKSSMKDFAKSLYLVANEIIDFDLYQRIEEDCDCFKNAPSGRTHIEHYINWVKKQENDVPYFACIHIDDIHNPEVFFTYDTCDIDLLQKEKEQAEKLLDQIPTNYSGCLTHDLSLRYIDSIIEYLYTRLEEEGFLENTCVVLCADHGFSFSGNPIRDSFVINLYLENYNIPCLITGAGYEGVELKNLCTSKDIPATLCELAFGEVPEGFSGQSILRNYEYPNVFIEYCGGGCPDLIRRELKMAAFNKNYFVGTLSSLETNIDETIITEVYDLQKDPLQKMNIVHKGYSLSKVQPLIAALNNRRNAILESVLSSNK